MHTIFILATNTSYTVLPHLLLPKQDNCNRVRIFAIVKLLENCHICFSKRKHSEVIVYQVPTNSSEEKKLLGFDLYTILVASLVLTCYRTVHKSKTGTVYSLCGRRLECGLGTHRVHHGSPTRACTGIGRQRGSNPRASRLYVLRTLRTESSD